MSYRLKVVAYGQENVALLKSYTGDSLLIDTNGNSNFYKNVDISGTLNYNHIEFGLFNNFINGLTKVVNNTSVTTFGNLGTAGDKCWGGVLAPNGKIYGIPRHGKSIIVITPSTASASASVSTTAVSLTSGNLNDNRKWHGGVLGQNGRIYGIPLSSTTILEINPVTNKASRSAFGVSLSGVNKWTGGVLAPNGKIYGIPSDSTDILVITPGATTTTASRTAVSLDSGSSLVGSNKWSGGVLAPNGKIYGIPEGSTSILVINPVTNKASTTAITVTEGSSLAGTWRGGVLAPNGKIYGIPAGANKILEIDPDAGTAATNTISLTEGSSLEGSEKWLGGVLAPNGKIYGFPFFSSKILEIDPVARTATTFGSVSTATYKWSAGVLAPNGKIYGTPFTISSIFEFTPSVTNLGVTINNNWMLEPYFNKY